MPEESMYRCPVLGLSSERSSRKLIVCIDGTANKFGIKNTNIVELHSHITKNDRQLVFYRSGLGTSIKVPKPLLYDQFSNIVDMGIGRNLDKIIRASYSWLSDNYLDGDEIFLFGFSRGAYQVRALAGMITRIGLLLPGNKTQIPFAFQLYSKTGDDDFPLMQGSSTRRPPSKEWLQTMAHNVKLAKTFRETFCRRDVHIHFIGVWDTVSSVGFDRSSALPLTMSTCEHVCYFRHALALDERRVKFLPEYVYGGRTSCSDDGRIKEVWFPGQHTDVGGRNERRNKLLSGSISLTWMRRQAVAAGLDVKPIPVTWKMDDLSQRIPQSVSRKWWPCEVIPFKRLLHNNSDRHTFRPHIGDPRRILPGQKVHASVLFMNNYAPYAVHLNGDSWPEPVFWNDTLFRDQLDELPGSWEKELFDRDSIQPLLLDLQGGRPNLDALDHLIFMANFDVCKDAMSKHGSAREILAPFLYRHNKLMRLSTAAIYCELGWDWPSKMNTDFGAQIIQDLSELLENNDHRACTYIPFLYKRRYLRESLVSERILNTLIRFCRSRPTAKQEITTPTAATRSSQALVMMMKLNPELAVHLIDIGAVFDLTKALHIKCDLTLVSVLGVLDGIAKHERGREVIKTVHVHVTLLGLVKRFDDRVAAAATSFLCSLLPDYELRQEMLQYGVLNTFLDILDGGTKRYVCDALHEFAQYDDVQATLYNSKGDLISLVSQAHHDAPNKRDIAITALVALGNTLPTVHSCVMDIIKETEMIDLLVQRLHHKLTALSAASTLAHLVNIDDVANMISDQKSGAPAAIVEMLRNSWFDGVHGEDGLQVLSRLLNNGPLRDAIRRAGAISVLRGMIVSAHHENIYAALHYLRVVLATDESWFTTTELETVHLHDERPELVSNALKALLIPDWSTQRAAIEVLRFFAGEEHLRNLMVTDLLAFLGGQRASVVLAASTMLGLLAMHESVRARVRAEPVFQDLVGEYYGGFNLVHDGSRIEEVYASVGRMIRLMWTSARAGSGKEPPRMAQQIIEDNKLNWPAVEPYMIKKPGTRWYWIGMLLELTFSHLVSSQEVHRKLWQTES